MKAKYDAYQGIIIYEIKYVEKRKCCINNLKLTNIRIYLVYKRDWAAAG